MFLISKFFVLAGAYSVSALSLHSTRQASGNQIHPNGQVGKCLTVRDNNRQNGTPVQINDCAGSPGQSWEIADGSTKVRLAGSNFCLDAGNSPGNGVQLKIWTCFDNLPAQQWFYTGDRRIALEGKGQCLDLPNGNTGNGQIVQTWQCTNFNTNQVWTTGSVGPPPSSSSSSSVPPTSSTTSSTPSTPTTPSSLQLHPNGNKSKCLDVKGGVQANGTPVQIYDCNGSAAQNWSLNQGSTKVRLTNTNFCLDAGANPSNGVGMKIWLCYDNLPAQQWYYTGDLRVAVEGRGQCLDLPGGNLANGNRVQTWQCTDGNVNQIWTR